MLTSHRLPCSNVGVVGLRPVSPHLRAIRASPLIGRPNITRTTEYVKPSGPTQHTSARTAPSLATCAAATADAFPTPSQTGHWAGISTPWDKEIFRLAVPALFSTLLDPVMGMVDTAIVGRLGTEPLAAVGLSTVLYNFSNFVFNFLLYTTTPRIAAAVSRNDRRGVSKITSQGLWLAASIGCVMTAVLFTNCVSMFKGMGATEGVLHHAVPYLRWRCIASPAIMMFYVMSGTFRGFKDTMTPLMAGVISNVIHLFLDIALVFWLGMGVSGAALATSFSHWVTLIILGIMIVKKGYLQVEDLLKPPKFKDVAPMLKNGALLSTRSLLAMSSLMFATKIIAGIGAVSLAAHEILRQIWVFSNQAFTCLDIATQSLVAFYLGRNDKKSAASVASRTLFLTVIAGFILLGSLLVARTSLPGVFTKDLAVIAQANMVMPLIALFMPLDAVASVMDGVLLGSQEAAWMSRTMIATASVCVAGLIACQKVQGVGLMTVWIVIKFLTVGRLIGNAWRIFVSEKSPLGNKWWIHSSSSRNYNGNIVKSMNNSSNGKVEKMASAENEEIIGARGVVAAEWGGVVEE